MAGGGSGTLPLKRKASSSASSASSSSSHRSNQQQRSLKQFFAPPRKAASCGSQPGKALPSLATENEDDDGDARVASSTPRSRRTASPLRELQHSFGGRTKSREELELEWAIRESLKDAEGFGGIARGPAAADTAAAGKPRCQRRQSGEKRDQDQPIPSAAPDPPLETPSPPQLMAVNTPGEHRQAPQCGEVVPVGDAQTPGASPAVMRPISDFAATAHQILPTADSPHVGDSGALETKENGATRARASKGNAFSKLMAQHSESKLWAAADVAEHENRFGAARTRPSLRKAPFYKVLTGMPISVDAFRFGRIEGCKAYFLTHFHSDHYGGLTAHWSHGPIYCSVTTANLVRTSLRVDERWIRPLPMNEACEVPDSGGVRVTLLDANHCPGSALFLFSGPQTAHILPPPPGCGSHPALPPRSRTFHYLHCGDFRASPRHVNHPAVRAVGRLDIVYLDTTYLNPRYCFPAQEQVVRACAQLVREVAPKHQLALAAKEEAAAAAAAKVEGWQLDGEPGQVKSEQQEEEEDWRNAPLRGRALKEAQEAAANAPSVRAMHGWLNSSAVGADEVARDGAAPGTTIRPNVGKSGAYDEDEEDAWTDAHGTELGDLDFQEEDVMGDAAEGDAIGSPVKEEPEPIHVLQKAVKQESAESCDDLSNAVKQEPADPPDLSGTDGGVDLQSSVVEAEASPDENDCKAKSVRSLNDVVRSGPDIKANIEFGTGGTKTASAASASDSPTGRLLVVVGTYTIGKEKIVVACARALRTRVFCMDSRKYRVYAQLAPDEAANAELHSLLTRDPLKAQVHVTNLSAIGGEGLRDHVAHMRARGMDVARAVAFRPTGWTYRPPAGMDTVAPSIERLLAWNQGREFGGRQLHPTRDSTRDYMIFGVPYSEHSSFFELTAFALSLDYERIIATVNVGSAASRARMSKWFERWKAERKRRGDVPVTPRSEDFF